MLTTKQIKDFQKEILEWFAKNKRDLPWRHSRDPYNILVSEVMLQQTQVSRVISKFENWIQKFPTVESLAHASLRDVLLAWSGLGYNRRALFLQKLAQEITRNYNGKFPQDESTLLKLPGIGKYTAKALMCFAFDQQIAVVDTNIRKVISVKFFNREVPKEKIVEVIAQQLLPKGKAYEWNQALMDYASAVLKKEKIAIPKQSKFKDSDRYYRGEILRLLLRKQKQTVAAIKDYLQTIGKEINTQRLQKILATLVKDGMCIQKGATVILAVE